MRLVDQVTELSTPANAPLGAQFQQTAPSRAGDGGFATDDGGVNDNGQDSGDNFTQNAQDQSSP